MPTRKQRRRREKELRHDYELVWEDAEGNELEPDDGPANGSDKRAAARPVARPGRAGRQAQPPSWQRTLRRGAIFAPIMFVTIYVLSPKLSYAEKIVQTLIILAIFIPFSYLLDGLMWRSHQRRAAKDQAARKRG